MRVTARTASNRPCVEDLFQVRRANVLGGALETPRDLHVVQTTTAEEIFNPSPDALARSREMPRRRGLMLFQQLPGLSQRQLLCVVRPEAKTIARIERRHRGFEPCPKQLDKAHAVGVACRGRGLRRHFFGQGINTAFDHDGDATRIVELIQPTQIFVNRAELEQNGYTLADVARYVMTLTKGQTALPTVTVPPDQQTDRVFEAAFPSKIMSRLPCLPEASP